MQRFFGLFIHALLLSSPAMAEDMQQPYKGHETRSISSLSDKDIAALREGSGWGLALPAELNGYPGPAHVLELADDLDLSDDQRQRVTEIFEDMRAEAIVKGNQLIEAERLLDAGFRAGGLDAGELEQHLERAERARADLRFVHLSRHLMTAKILDAPQVKRYAVLRGYATDPCSSVPEGHDPAQWQHHNDCDAP